MSDVDERKMKKVQAFVGMKHYELLLYYSNLRKMPMSRLIAIAVDNECGGKVPFEFDTTLPTDEYVEYAFATEAGKIINYLRSVTKGMPLDMLLILREDVGIPDKKNFLAAFRECLEKNMVEGYENPNDKKYDTSTIFYRLPQNAVVEKQKVKKKISEYQRYQKLRKKYGDN